MEQVKHVVLMAGAVVLVLLLFAALVRAVLGPRFTDRIIAINVVNTIVVAIITLLGLACKNAILIIEFAVELRDQGRDLEEAAVEAFINYVKGLYRDNHMKWPDKLIREARNALKEDGRAQVDLHDGCCVSCVLYRDDTTNIKE